MCGFVAFFEKDREHFRSGQLGELVVRMTDEIAHRGPDDASHWIDSDSGLTLGFRRLAILDLSEHGRQPMHSPCGRFVVTFNGEIYNYAEIKKQLERQAPETLKGIQGHSDTGVLLAAVKAWGFENTLRHLVGMFAIVLWDRKSQELYLARDRGGEKPFYYGWNNGVFYAASELKSLRAHPRFNPEISQVAFQEYVHFNYIRSPLSIYKNIYKLPPASWLRLSLAELETTGSDFDPSRSPFVYWQPKGGSLKGQLRDEEVLNSYEAKLSEALKLQMVADVPVGAFLSGGLDSTLIVSLMRQFSEKKVKTFTIGFEEKSYDESAHARKIAEWLKTDHYELIATPKMCMDLVPKMARLYDEPFADSSQIPTFLVSKLARENVTVSLSGDGGDELFGGYTRYFQAHNLWTQLMRIPKPLRKTISLASQWLPKDVMNAVSGILDQNKAQKFVALAQRPNLETLYELLMYNLAEPSRLLAEPGSQKMNYLIHRDVSGVEDFFNLLMDSDFKTYLPDDIFVKVDRATMGNSLESRAPFLDHRVIEFVRALPLEYKVSGGRGKCLTRRLLERFVPSELFNRPKMGFGQPVGIWMRGPLKEWCEELISPTALSRNGLWNVKEVRAYWESHLSEKANYQYLLWNVLMYQAWADEWL